MTNKKRRRKLTKTAKALIGLLIKFAVIGVTAFILLTYVGGVYVCHSNDMSPSIKDGDLAITYKLAGYYNGDPLVYEHEGKAYFGRVIGVDGDTIDFTESGFTVNGNYPYENVYYPTEARESDIKYPITLKEGELFVLSDYRTEGMDSRVFGVITNPKGTVVLLLRRRGI